MIDYYKLKQRQFSLEKLAATASPEELTKIINEYNQIHLQIKAANKLAALKKK